MIGEVRAALHVVDPGPERDVPVDRERQALDEAERMQRVEMAEDQDARLILSPRRAHEQMVAATIATGDPLDHGIEPAIAVCDHGNELVDLIGRLGGRLDLDPLADAFEDCSTIERSIADGHEFCEQFLMVTEW